METLSESPTTSSPIPFPVPPPFLPKGAQSLIQPKPGSPTPILPAGKGNYFPITPFSRTFPASRSRLHCPHRPHPHPWRNPRPQPHEDPARPPSCLPSYSRPCRSGTRHLGKLSRRGKVASQVDQSKAKSKSRPRRGENTQMKAGLVLEDAGSVPVAILSRWWAEWNSSLRDC